jgi:hypothetical protein
MMHKIVAGTLLMFVAAQTVAAANSLAFVAIPTLDELGVVSLTVVVAIAGALAARRRKKK